MGWIRDMVLALLITSAGGSIVFLMWVAVVYAGREKRNIRYGYRMLRGVLVGYLLSFIYLAAWRCMGNMKHQHDILSVATAFLERVFFVFFLIWLAVVLLRMASLMHLRRSFKGMEKSRMAAPKGYNVLLQKLCGEMGIRKNVCLYQGYGVQTPFIYGVRQPEIYLPVKEFPEEELEMILYHELVHYQQGDTFWEPLFGMAEIIYWFNPLSKLLWREAVRWTEANCDSYCCEGRFAAKKYFTLLLSMGTIDEISENRYTPMWSGGRAELSWRIHCVKKQVWKETGTAFTVVLAAVFLFVGSMSAHAAAGGARVLYQQAYSSTVEGAEVLLQPEDMLWHCMEYNPAIDELLIRKRKEINQDSAKGLSIAGEIDWNVRAKAAYYSDGFQAGKGEDIRIRMAARPICEEIQVGIVKPNGEIAYVVGRNFISHSFHASGAGEYKVFVRNGGGKTVEVEGSYMFHKGGTG